MRKIREKWKHIDGREVILRGTLIEIGDEMNLLHERMNLLRNDWKLVEPKNVKVICKC